jgi:bisphosphoglycerate-dependent phosphoglycerate mutase
MHAKFSSLLTIAGLALATTTAQAQATEQALSAPAVTVAQGPLSLSAAELTRDMSTRLKLNEGQYIKLYGLNKIRVNQVAQIQRDFNNDPSTQSAKMAELDAQYQQECSRILTPSQLSQLQDNKQSQPAQAGNGIG